MKVNVKEIAHGIMKDFMFAQEDKKIHDVIYNVIHQKGAFRKFRQVIEQVGILQKWYEFRDKEYEVIVKEWCETNGLEWE